MDPKTSEILLPTKIEEARRKYLPNAIRMSEKNMGHLTGEQECKNRVIRNQIQQAPAYNDRISRSEDLDGSAQKHATLNLVHPTFPGCCNLLHNFIQARFLRFWRSQKTIGLETRYQRIPGRRARRGFNNGIVLCGALCRLCASSGCLILLPEKRISPVME